LIPQLPPRWFWVVAVFWFSIGLAAAAYRTIRIAATEKSQGPDGFVLAFIVFAFAVFILPLIAKLDFSDKGASIEFRKEAEQVTDEVSQNLKRAITSVATLLGNWLSLQNTVQWQFTVPGLATSKAGYGYAVSVARSAMNDAAAWLFADGEAWRTTVWQLAPSRTGLIFAFGLASDGVKRIGTDLPQATLDAFQSVGFLVGGDLFIGDAWANLRIGNFADAPPTNRPPSPNQSGYRGIMFVPVLRDGRRWAVMVVERALETRYNDSAEAVASALGSFVGSVLSYPLAEYPPP
jgi:GAF domain-containing protein